MPFEQLLEGGDRVGTTDITRKSMPGSGKSQCKGPEVGAQQRLGWSK